MFGRKPKVEERQAREFGVSELGTARRCAVCLGPGTQEVFRANAKGEIDRSSRRFACGDHVKVEALYPVRLSAGPNVMTLGKVRGVFGGEEDMYLFYGDVVREMGGEVPVPDKVEPTVKRKRWFGLGPLPAPKFVAAGSRFRRPRGMSGRQWVKFRKHEGLVAQSR